MSQHAWWSAVFFCSGKQKWRTVVWIFFSWRYCILSYLWPYRTSFSPEGLSIIGVAGFLCSEETYFR